MNNSVFLSNAMRNFDDKILFLRRVRCYIKVSCLPDSAYHTAFSKFLSNYFAENSEKIGKNGKEI